jgi:hypothetical protein
MRINLFASQWFRRRLGTFYQKMLTKETMPP